MVFDLKQFKDVFISETEDHLAKLNANLLSLEINIKANYKDQILKDPINKADSLLLDELMRSSHTIKSSAATMGYVKMAFLTHVLEDVFDYARNKMISIDLSIVDQIFSGIDALKNSLHSIRDKDQELDVEEFSQKIKEITGVATDGVSKSIRDENGQPIVVAANKKDKIIEKTPVSPVSENRITDEIEEVSHIKVPVGRLDSLMDLTEEIVIDRMRLTSIIDDGIKQTNNSSDLVRREVLSSIKPAIDHLSLLLSSLQYSVMQMRLVPVENIFSRFPRMIRDLAKSKNKEISLSTKGSDLEVDRTIIDKLAEPLVHLLRNAIDHGIEKNGSISLEAKREREFVLISVQDDGGGINWSGVVEAAKRKEMISSETAEDLLNKIKSNPQTEWQREVEPLLFTGRLSTKKEVTETSGRGVGLSVVKNFVDEIGGNLTIVSPVQESGGTAFILELPLTLAITEALLVKIKNNIFAIPFSSILRVVMINNANIKSIGDQDVAVVDEAEVPLANLEKIFHLQLGSMVKLNNETNEHKSNISEKTVVLTRRGREVAGIIVDKVLNQQQIIIKPLPTILRGVKGFSGSTILGNGEVVLIIDVVSLLQNSQDLLRIK